MCVICQNINANASFSASSEPLLPQLLVNDNGQPQGVQILAHWSWAPNNLGQGVNLTYSFVPPTIVPSVAFNATQKQNTVLALDAFERVGNINYTESTTTAQINFGYGSLASLGSGVRGAAWLPSNSPQITQVPIVMDTNLGNFNVGTFDFMALMHEIGHSMGLKHPFDPSPSVPSGNPLAQVDNSFMSYADGAIVSRSEPTGLMYWDARSIGFLYGYNPNQNSGNTTYTFGTKTVEAIWDAGGIDVVDASADTNGARIDLRTDGGSEQWNFINSSKIQWLPGSNIEHAIGGPGSDTIIGSDIGNELYGGNGNDTVNGGGGGDVLFGGTGFSSPDDGHDLLYGGNGSDLIFGNAGNDTIYGDGGPGVTATAPGNDTIYGGAGNDFMNGEKGFDMLIGGGGNDSLYGGADADLFVFANDLSGGVNIIYDFQGAGAPGGDVIRILAGANGSGFQTAADVIAAVVTGSGHSYIPVVNSSGQGYAILVGWTTNLSVDDIQVVSAASLLNPSFTITT